MLGDYVETQSISWQVCLFSMSLVLTYIRAAQK